MLLFSYAFDWTYCVRKAIIKYNNQSEKVVRLLLNILHPSNVTNKRRFRTICHCCNGGYKLQYKQLLPWEHRFETLRKSLLRPNSNFLAVPKFYPKLK